MALLFLVTRIACIGLLVPAVLAKVHHLFVGNLYAPAVIHALSFDDETLGFRYESRISADAAHAWIAFNPDKTHVYGASLSSSSIASYRVTNATGLELVGHVAARDQCAGKTSAFVVANPRAPHNVFSAAWPGPNACGMSLSAGGTGALREVDQSWAYQGRSGVHGLALGRGPGGAGQLLYSADLQADTIWVHAVSEATGRVTELARHPVTTGLNPRHLVAHANGAYLYVVMEAGNRMVAYKLDEKTGVIASQASTFSLLPTGFNPGDYWSAEIMLSPNSRYLWATARAKPNSTNRGYISVFLLQEDGAVAKQLFRVPTTTTGGIANAIAPAPWGDEWAAMADSGTGYVQMWQMKGKNETELGIEYADAEAVGRVDIDDGGCCANVIWYD